MGKRAAVENTLDLKLAGGAGGNGRATDMETWSKAVESHFGEWGAKEQVDKDTT